MSSWLHTEANTSGNLAFAQGSTNYTALSGSYIAASAEAETQTLVRASFTLKNLWASVSANSGTQTLRTRKNGTNGNNAVSITSTGTFEDTTHTDSLVSGDLVNYQIVIGGSHSNSATLRAFGVLMDDGGSGRTIIGGITGGADSVTPTRYAAMGQDGFIATEANTQLGFYGNATVSNLRSYIQANPGTGNITINSRKNSTAGNQSVSYSGSTTGALEDTTHSDSLISGDLLAVEIAFAGASGTVVGAVYHLSAAMSNRPMGCGPTGAASKTVDTSQSPYFLAIESPIEDGSSTESHAQVKARVVDVFTRINCKVVSNTRSDSTTVNLRAGAASPSGGPSMSIASSATGRIEDLTGTYTTASTDLINFRLLLGGGTGSIKITYIAIQQGTIASSSALTETASDDANNLAEAVILGRGNLHADTLQSLSDTFSFAIGIPKTFSDDINLLADSTTFAYGYAKFPADSLQALTDILVKLMSYELALADSEAANWVDSHQLLLAYFLSLADFYTLSDASTIVLGERVEFSDVLNSLAEAVDVVPGYEIPLADDAATLADAESHQLGQWRTFSDSLVLTDELALGHGLLPTDSLDALTDSATVVLGYELPLADDTDTLADTHALQLGYLLVLTDTQPTYIDYVTACLYLLGVEIECVDSAAHIGLEFYDSFTLTDAFAKQLISNVAEITLELEDSITPSDSLALGYGLLTNDVLVLSDNETNQLGQLITFTDALSLTDTALINEAHLFEFNDSYTIIDSESRVLGHNELFTDSITLTDSSANQLGQLFSFSDSVNNLADTYAQLANGLLGFSDTLSLSDSLLLGYGLAVSDDTNLLADSVSLVLDELITLTDSLLASTDSIALGYGLALTDIVALSDSTQLQLSYQLALADDANLLADSIALQLYEQLELTDSFSLTDSELHQLGQLLALADMLAITDGITIVLGESLALADTLTLTDSTVQVVGGNLTLTDSFILTNSLALGYGLLINDDINFLGDDIATTAPQGPGREVGVTDALVTLSDAVALQLGHLLAVADDANLLGDSLAVNEGLLTTLTDSFNLTDSETATLGHLRPLADALATLSDSLQLQLGVQFALSDTVTVTDSGAQLLSYQFALADNASNWADSLAFTLGLAVIITDNAPTLTDVESALLQHLLRIADSLVLTDALAKFSEEFLGLADSIVIDDSAAIELRGPDRSVSAEDALALTDAIALTLGNELRLQLALTDSITLIDHYFDLRHPLTPSTKRHVVVSSPAGVTIVPGRDSITVPASDRITRVR